MSATYLSFAIIKLSNKISGVMDQSSRPTAAYRQTTHMKNEYVSMFYKTKRLYTYYKSSLQNERTITASSECS